ncbi:MAG: bifunctional hydroxymethylpyrimidine kinase/phosphomethylpyrimidine kinase [Anaerolineae bacterium]|nr:bifunctional hydroxymethylpyrimidine kinase/phosphomethylpyrimidine kinase [Anaerolineae bacterium]
MTIPTIPCVLTIAASDPSGAAGVQADLKTFEARQVYGLSAITALSVQNSVSFQGLRVMEADFVRQQIEALVSDINIAAIKTGMLLRADIIETVIAAIPPQLPAVIDPVFVTGEGKRFVDDPVIEGYRRQLFPRATLITPNLLETAILVGHPVEDVPAMREAARQLHQDGARAVLIKGGHLATTDHMIDVLYDGRDFYEMDSPYLPVKNPRGTGCTFASCIAAELAKGADLLTAARTAKAYVAAALEAALDWHIGHGRGTLFHGVGNKVL